jgi:hypothetical protein
MTVDGNLPLVTTTVLTVSAVGQVTFDPFLVYSHMSFMGGARATSIPRGRLSVFGQFIFGRTRFALDTQIACDPDVDDCTFSFMSWGPGGGVNIMLTDRLQARAQIDVVTYRARNAPTGVRYWFGVAVGIGDR